ncbi:hypothetical protein TNIN_267541 [Trichonephila inaurata madagascariensis]|uniref:Uncharacterized protein n=1 Tax=Trichonephila inaurata madagascariensis TaxID=2747483 RepID=A0A8X6X2Y4_9ARAC|nr:hypothetical protein TNIN_267541 [Trichonephila inaurata madagascariensis]
MDQKATIKSLRGCANREPMISKGNRGRGCLERPVFLGRRFNPKPQLRDVTRVEISGVHRPLLPPISLREAEEMKLSHSLSLIPYLFISLHKKKMVKKKEKE